MIKFAFWLLFPDICWAARVELDYEPATWSEVENTFRLFFTPKGWAILIPYVIGTIVCTELFNAILCIIKGEKIKLVANWGEYFWFGLIVMPIILLIWQWLFK